MTWGHKSGTQSPMAETIAYMGLATGGQNEFLSQPVWFIDPINGNDNNDGATAATALKTWAELNKRWGVFNTLTPTPLTSTSVGDLPVTTVNILGNLPATDPINMSVNLEMGAIIHVVGGSTVARAGTVTAGAITTQDPALNVRWSFFDVGTTAADVNNLIQFTSGPNSGLFSWVAVVNTGDENVTLSSIQNVTPFPAATYPGESGTPPAVGNTYNVLSLTQATLGAINIGYQGNPTDAELGASQPGGIYFDLMHFTVAAGDQGGWSAFVNNSVGVAFNRCKIDNSINWLSGQLIGLNSGWFGQGDQGTSGGVSINAAGNNHLFTGGLINCSPGWVGPPTNFLTPAVTCKAGRPAFDGNVMLQSTVLTVEYGSSAVFGSAAVFDAPLGAAGGSLVDTVGGISAIGLAIFTGLQLAGTSRVWGDGNAGVGVGAFGNCFTFFAPFFPLQPTITGVGGDFSVGAENGVITANSVYGVDLTVVSPPGSPYVGPTLCTWNNLFAPLAVGTGFGGQAVNPKKMAVCGS